MFNLRSAFPVARSLAAPSKASPCSYFHTSTSALAKQRKSRKEIVIQVRKNNIQKQEKKRLEYENSTPDYIIGKETEFTRSLLKPQSLFQSPLAAIKPTGASDDESSAQGSKSAGSTSTSSIFSSPHRTPLVVSTSNPSGYQHFLNEQEVDIIFEKAPKVQVQELVLQSTLVNEAIQLPIERQKAELVRRITALENGSAKQITLENVRRAIAAFQREEGDTGSPEVQAAVMTVRIQNLNNHITNNKKDVHNYRRLRMLVHQRQTVLKYLKKTNPERYHSCLDRLGLEPRAIEDEIVI
ncbi:hypothetical protein BGZ76_011091 [Entomortierella beljakovae]|nr:hypothetical protein BGZ76_011091 [Entomortierella beljakovae]